MRTFFLFVFGLEIDLWLSFQGLVPRSRRSSSARSRGVPRALDLGQLANSRIYLSDILVI